MLTGALPFQGSNRKETMNQILKAKLGMPYNISPKAQELLRALFKRNPANRLGSGKLQLKISILFLFFFYRIFQTFKIRVYCSIKFTGGVEQIKSHGFFASIDWDALYKKEVIPPFKPAVSQENDALCFDSEFTCITPKGNLKIFSFIRKRLKKFYELKYTGEIILDSPGVPPSANAHELFRGFSFIAPGLLEEHSLSSEFKHSGSISNTFPTYVSLVSVRDEYDFKQEIGKGTYSTVYLAIHKATKTEYAIKVCKTFTAPTSSPNVIRLEFGILTNGIKIRNNQP